MLHGGVVAEILGPDLLVIFLVIALLFGGSQIPKLARSLGQASREFRRGVAEGPDKTTDPGEVDKRRVEGSDSHDDKVTLTRAELDALIAQREDQARREWPPTKSEA